MRKVVGIVVVVALLFSACDHRPELHFTAATYLREFRHLDVRTRLSLESVEKLSGTEGAGSGQSSGSFFLFFGSGSGSFDSKTQPTNSLQFAIKTGTGELIIVAIPYADITFNINDSVQTPYVHILLSHEDIAYPDKTPLSKQKHPDWLFYKNTIHWNQESSTGRIITAALNRVDLTLSQKLFNTQVAPLLSQAADASTR